MVQLASEAVAQTRAAKLIVLDRDGVINHDSDAYIKNPAFARDEAIRSGAFAAMTLMIAAQARGYATGPMIGFEPEKVKKLFEQRLSLLITADPSPFIEMAETEAASVLRDLDDAEIHEQESHARD